MRSRRGPRCPFGLVRGVISNNYREAVVGGEGVRDALLRGSKGECYNRDGQTYGGIIAMRPRATSRILCRMYMRRVTPEAGASLSMRRKIS